MIWRLLPDPDVATFSRTSRDSYAEVKGRLDGQSTFIDSANSFSWDKELLAANPAVKECTPRQDHKWRKARSEQRAKLTAFTFLIRNLESQIQERRQRGDQDISDPYHTVLQWTCSKDTASRQRTPKLNSMHYVIDEPYSHDGTEDPAAAAAAAKRIHQLQACLRNSFACSDIDYLSVVCGPRGFEALLWLGSHGMDLMGVRPSREASTVVAQLQRGTSLDFDEELYVNLPACSRAPSTVVMLTGSDDRRGFHFSDTPPGNADADANSANGHGHLETLCKRLALVSTKFKKGKTRLSLGPIDRWDLTKFGMHADTPQEEVNVTIGGTIERFRTDETRRTCPGWDFIESTDVARDRLYPESRGRYKGVLDE